MKTEFALAFNEVLEEKQLPRDVIIAAIESAMVSAYRKSVSASNAQEVTVKIDMDTGLVNVFAEKEVVEEVANDRTEVTLEEARLFEPEAQLGDLVMVEATPENFGRVAAQTARQVIQQRIRDAEKGAQMEYYGRQVGEIVSGVVQAVNPRQATIGLDLKAEGTMLRKDMIPGERFRIHDRIRSYVYEVKDSQRGLQILLSRAHRNFLRRLLENEVPEIYHGIVEIRSIAREPGQRAKVAVSATQQGIDPVGACVGVRGVRIQTIVRELHDEKIDVIEWNSDAAVYISKAISPARVSGVYLNTETGGNKTAMVVVPEDQLSLAIGREGQNARLAAKLTGWRIDIMSLTEASAKALVKLREEPAYAELAAVEVDTMPKIEDLLQKKDEGRLLSQEEYTSLARFVDRVEKRGEAERKAEDESAQARLKAIKDTIPVPAFEIPILDVQLKEHILNLLQEAGFETLGDLILQARLDPDMILAYKGIGPKSFAEIMDFIEGIKVQEEAEELVTEAEGVTQEVGALQEIPEDELIPVEAETQVDSSELKEIVSAEPETADVVDTSLDTVPVPTAPEAEGVEGKEEQPEEEIVFEDMFKVGTIAFDYVPEDEQVTEDEDGTPLTDGKKKKSKKKKGYTVEYDPDKDQATVLRKHKRDDGWEEW